MRYPTRLACLAIVAAATTACAVRLVAPYNAQLAQNASAMQAEVVAWELTMRGGAGTVADDPRHPDVIAKLNKWRGEAEAMVTLAVSNDPGAVNCSAVEQTFVNALSPEQRAAASSSLGAAGSAAAPGCEALLVGGISAGIDRLERDLKYCRVDWVPDGYFTALAQNRAAAVLPPAPPNAAAQVAVQKRCIFELRPPAPGAGNAPSAQHGPATLMLLTTLQSIVYVESRKKDAVGTK